MMPFDGATPAENGLIPKSTIGILPRKISKEWHDLHPATLLQCYGGLRFVDRGLKV